MRWVRLCGLAAVCLAAGTALGRAQATADKKAAEAAMWSADEAFNKSVADRDVSRLRALVAEDATFGGGTPNQLRGRDAIVKAWTPFLQADGPTLTWKPAKAEALAGADVGYTIGFSERRAKGADGRVTVSRGNYLTVWKKQRDGSWQAVFDTGSTVPE